MNDNDTIVAVATPPGMGGIGVVRLSGPEALKLSQKIFFPAGRELAVDTCRPRTAVYGEVHDLDSGHAIDRGLLTWFRHGASYTGEEVVEISCHGSRPILRRVVEMFCEIGARPSGPGEFTLRAVLAGRLDLTQAEAVNRLIRADTLVQAEDAVRQIDGSVSKQVESLESDLLDTIAAMEVAVDFAEEGDDSDNSKYVAEKLNSIQIELNEVVGLFTRANTLRDGATVVIAGKSNAGKSTLFNLLLQQERSIVDAEPGTTRDFISETIDMDGLPVTIYDTAGLRTGGQVVEQEGMRRSEQLILSADLVLHLTVAGEELSPEDTRIRRKLEDEEIDYLKLDSKFDRMDGECIRNGDIAISAVTSTGISELQEQMRDRLAVDELRENRNYITERRQQQLFITISDHISNAIELQEQGHYYEMVLEELTLAMNALTEITGRGGTEEILTRVFSSFCIGK